MKKSKADKLRELGLPYPSFQWHHLRYKFPPEKGAYWYFFSIKIRERDVKKWGICISCGRKITVQNSQCGHFVPAGVCGRDLLFDEKNNNAECSHCNAWDEMHLIGYAKNLDLRYGRGTSEKLLERYRYYKFGPPVKDWSKKEYVKLLNTLKRE